MNEAEFVDLVEQHRQQQLMGLPPVGLLDRAQQARAHRRRRTAAIPAGLLVAAALVVGAAHTLGEVTGSRVGPAPPGLTHPIRPTTKPTTRVVGLNGWVVQVPASWGTDQIGCDRAGSIRPSVLFDHHGPPLRPARPCAWPRGTFPFLRIGEERFQGVPWRTISGVEVDRRRHPVCPTCATLRVPTAGVSFEIQASSARSLHAIEDSLHPISSNQVTVPVWTASATGHHALDQMTTIATGQGLRPRSFQVPSRLAPGTFLRSDPPLGTPVDLGHAIALFFSAGDLGRYATLRSLSRRGWRIFPVTSDQPTYGRAAAVRAAGVSRKGGAHHPAFLRTLTITHEGPRRVVIGSRLAWLVVGAQGGPGPSVSITAVDATTARVIETQNGLHGRRP